MKKSNKKWIIIASSFIIIGILMFASVMTAYNWDFTNLSTGELEVATYDITDKFDDIFITINSTDVVFKTSVDGKCKVVCNGINNDKHTVIVENNALKIRVDNKKWYECLGFNFSSPKIEVYLPATEYGVLSINGTTGDVNIENNLVFSNINISYTTGDLTLSNLTCSKDLKASVTTGAINLKNIKCNNMISDGTTGDISLNNVIVTNKLAINRVTGDISFVACDAQQIFIDTTTGDVEGTLLTDKVFNANATTGDVTVPNTTTGGICIINTTTGDILIGVKE